ncbi:hypothetical protein LEP1GSC060_1937 [Leptospira weilii serovar Ranarum str. ICFT]|uniref:Uncharacterized protein n=1 Tax=Leptospira weilii serovar Ranarum str. ICFT TaxID=1218598 RepID=N1WC47_9LEPT|nr:hypothetical protein LEP1GSC060_1937 [Leptospira weilii serovar Ranarum str. ICFT]
MGRRSGSERTRVSYSPKISTVELTLKLYRNGFGQVFHPKLRESLKNPTIMILVNSYKMELEYRTLRLTEI